MRLWRESPDSNAVVDAAFRTALRYLEMKVPEAEQATRRSPGVETGLLLPEGLAALGGFRSHYPESPYAAEASRMIVTVLNRMELYDLAIGEARRFIVRYPKSPDLDDVQWYIAESCFSADDFAGAFEAGRVILDGKFPAEAGSAELVESPYVPHVKYLFAKIHHLKGKLAEAVRLYEEVAPVFEDARDAFRYLTAEDMVLPESAVFAVGERPRVTLRRKNIESLEIRIYPVDLMLLMAVKKDLTRAADVDLTGIAAKIWLNREFPSGRDFRWHEEDLDLGLAEKGAYLVLARSGEMVRSSIVVVSDLSISVQPTGGRVRIYATNSKTRQPEGDVFVTVGDGSKIHAQGFTDARGVFECESVRGRIQVVAEKEGHAALHR